MPIKTLLEHKKFWLISAIFWTAFVFYLCLIDGRELPSLSIKGNYFDKFVHFIFHFTFSGLWIFYNYLPSKTIEKKQIVKVLAWSVIFGIVIEILQGTLTTNRHADVFDVLANTTGAITAGIIIFFLLKKRNKLKT